MIPLDVPPNLLSGRSGCAVVGNVAGIYNRLAVDLRDGSRSAPTFDDAVAVALHRTMAAIEQAAAGGQRIHLA